MKINKQDIYFSISLITGIYFALVSGTWIYYVNIIFGMPTFLISYIFWKKGKENDIKIRRYKYVQYIWLCGIPIGIFSLIGYLIFN
jgi:O-antigen/teichoic acid export membrane protein